KTTTLLELVQHGIAQFETDTSRPVPVVFNLSSWVENEEELIEWLVEELSNKYQVPQNHSRVWIERSDLVLLLDGLDEIPADKRPSCVLAINRFRKSFGFSPIAVCSRTDDYKALTARLSLECAILLQPLTDEQIDNYLRSGSFDAVRMLIDTDA